MRWVVYAAGMAWTEEKLWYLSNKNGDLLPLLGNGECNRDANHTVNTLNCCNVATLQGPKREKLRVTISSAAIQQLCP
jgi:hypothetical protein